MDFHKIKMINAGAGSGKTYKITELLYESVNNENVPPSSIFATTFTNKAAAELLQRVRQKFLEKAGTSTSEKDKAALINEARIGTLHSLCAEYLKRFALDLGLSPDVEVLEEDAAASLFRIAMDEEDAKKLQDLDRLGEKLSIIKNPRGGNEPLDFAKGIANEAVANGIDADELPCMAERSWELYNKLLDESCGEVTQSISKTEFIRVGKQVLKALEETGKANNQKWHKNFKRILSDKLKKWSDWEKEIDFGKKIADIVEPYTRVQSKLGQCADFRSDIKNFIQLSYEVAANSMKRYRELKDNRGVLDFADLERQFLILLDNPLVKDVLKAELSLLMVDEFQDTNPMQLAIYLKLTNLVDKAVFVGDLKQAIYGFRGSDPELMLALQNALQKQGVEIEKLDTSRRSTTSIVEHCNAVFSPIFGEKETTLKVWSDLKWQPSCGSPELFSIIQTERSKDDRNRSFTEKLKQFLHSSPKVLDKDTNVERKMHWGDVGILVRKNSDAIALAESLTEAGIPAQCDQPGLLEEPEVVLVRALMAIASSSDNRIAYAEARSIIYSESVDDWLSELFADGAEPSGLLSDDLIRKLDILRDKRQQFSPTELLTSVIGSINVVSMIRRWDVSAFKTQQRLANLDAFNRLVEQYEQAALAQGLPVTQVGLNQFLKKAVSNKVDIKGQPTGHAVSVLTIHKAKGLEWPCVILAFLDKERKEPLFGITVQNDNDDFNVSAPLKDRWVTFLPPYSSDKSNGTVKKALKTTKFGQKRLAKANEEEHRLLYVAFTRARNYLATFHDGKSNDKRINSLLGERDYDFADISNTWPLADTDHIEAQLPYVEPTPQSLKPRYIQPSAAGKPSQIDVVNSSRYGESLTLEGAVDTAKLGDAVHQLIGYIIINDSRDVDSLAKKLFSPFTSDENKIKQLAKQARAFVETMYAQFNPSKAWVEMPIAALNDTNQTIKGNIDLLLETSGGLVVIDHKLRGAKTLEQQQQLANDYGGQLATYKEAIEANGYTVSGLVLNAFNSGSILKVSVKH